MPEHASAFLDWLACAHAGRDEPASVAARGLGTGVEDRVIAAGTAGHVLDFDDTYLPGLVHLSAPVAPVALVVGAAIGANVELVLGAYAAGIEATAAVARASHPALYDRGWHPTAVCGRVGAATAAGALIGLNETQIRSAQAIALLSSGGMRAAFGSDGKALQVGMAAAAGLTAARLAGGGAQVPPTVFTGRDGFEDVFGGAWAEPDAAVPAASDIWIKAYPCCLQTHSSIEAAEQARAAGAGGGGRISIVVHPVSRRAAPFDDVDSGLEAKFSIPYTAALTLARGVPGVDDFATVDAAARARARLIEVSTDPSLLESEARLETDDGFSTRVAAARGSPQRPMSPEQHDAKIAALAGNALKGIDGGTSAADAAAAAGLY